MSAITRFLKNGNGGSKPCRAAELDAAVADLQSHADDLVRELRGRREQRTQQSNGKAD